MKTLLDVFPEKNSKISKVNVYFTCAEIFSLIKGERVNKEGESVDLIVEKFHNELEKVNVVEQISTAKHLWEEKDFIISGDVIVEIVDTNEEILEIKTGYWETSILELCSPASLAMDFTGLTANQLLTGMYDGTIEPLTVSMPDILAAANDVEDVKISFNKVKQILSIEAMVDQIFVGFSVG